MSKENNLNENIRENSEEKKTAESIVKITISKEAETRLADVMERVNDGFEAGKVNRQDLASWALRRFSEECDSETVKAIRQDFFDEFAFLEGILRRCKETGKLPAELRNALKQHLGAETAPRKSKKSLTQNYINDVVGQDEDSKAV